MRTTEPHVSFRRLAHELRPHSPEPMRRLLRRYVRGERAPGPVTRSEIIVALRRLGADTAELESGDDEEDSDLMRAVASVGDLAHDLLAEVERLKRRIKEIG